MVVSSQQKTFYIETFGCQMNFHDSEKVVGSLISQGYQQVEREQDADLIFYNTCSIRDKAEQKVFHRLADVKKLQKEESASVYSAASRPAGGREDLRTRAMGLARRRLGFVPGSARDAGADRVGRLAGHRPRRSPD